MKEGLVSIIIPVYNAENYLLACLESAFAQTWPYKEIIVVDDGSTDHSLNIAKKYEQKGAIVLSQVNKGASAARNLGLKHCNGDYIQFLDADDLLHPDKIRHQAVFLADRPDAIALCPTVGFFDGEDYRAKEISHEWYKSGSINTSDFLIKLYGGSLIGEGYGGAIQPNAWLSPRAIIEKAGKWNENLSLDDDGEFFCRAVLASPSIIYSEKSINYYRKFKKSRSLSASNSIRAFQSALLANQLKKKHLLEATDDPQAKIALARYFMELALNSYPQFRSISNHALKEAKALGGCTFDPYPKGIKNRISKIAGWKNVRLLEYLRTNFN